MIMNPKFKAISSRTSENRVVIKTAENRAAIGVPKTRVSISALIFAIPIVASAASNDLPPLPANEASATWKNSIEQQQIWQDSIQKQRIESLRQSQQLPQPEPTGTETDSRPTECLPIQRIELGALPALSRKVQNNLRQRAEQLALLPPDCSTTEQDTSTKSLACISTASANQLIRDITAAYLEAGYFKIAIDSKSTKQGVLTLQVYLAKITDIENQTDLPTSRLFGNIIDKPANMSTLDQAVSNGERVIDGRLILDVFPVGKDVRIKVTQQGEADKIQGDMEYRYDPDDSYGHNQIKLHGTLRNVFGQAELISLTAQQSLQDNYGYDEDNQRRSASIYTIIPNGRWQWSALLAADDYTRITQMPNSLLEQAGDSWQANIRGDYTFDRDQDSISTVYGQVAHQDVTSELLGSRLDVQSPKLSSIRLGASHTKLFNSRSKSNPRKVTTGALVVDLSAEKGVGNHDNPATQQGLSDDYLRWLLSAYLTHQHAIVAADENKGYWQMTHELQGQYSDDQLYGISQQSIGSTYSGVRGVDNVYTAAESGITLRNTLSYEPKQSDWLKLGAQKIRWSPYIGADYGMVKDSKSDFEEDSSNATSGTVGLKLTGYDVKGQSLERRWLFDFSASRAHVDYANNNYEGTQDTEVSAAWQWFF